MGVSYVNAEDTMTDSSRSEKRSTDYSDEGTIEYIEGK